MEKKTLKTLMKEYTKEQIKLQMTEEKLTCCIKNMTNIQLLEEDSGYLLFRYDGKKIALLYDVEHNRMRIIAPITEYSILAPKIKESLMSANFHSTLDARYSVSQDTLYAMFAHPLRSLHEDDFLSALKQVSNLVTNFGETYSSAQLEFTKKK